MLQGFRQAFRSILARPAFAVASTLTLGVGLGVVTTVFGLLHATVFRPLPFEAPDRLVMLYLTERIHGREDRMRWPYAAIGALREGSQTLEIASFTSSEINLVGTHGNAERVSAEFVSPSYFRVLRVRPVSGRTFTDETGIPGRPAEVVIGAGLWQRHFARAADVVGARLQLEGTMVTVVGVLPSGFDGLSSGADLWLPETMAPVITYRDYLTSPQYFHNVVGRLEAGATLEQADAEVRVVARRIAALLAPRTEGATDRTALVRSLGEARQDPQAVRARWLLLAAAGLVLLLAAVNVAGLSATRLAGRDREMTIRVALGCGRGRLFGLLATETALVAIAGLAIGLLLFLWATAFVRALVPTSIASPSNDYAQVAMFNLPGFEAVSPLFAVAVAIGATLVIVLMVGTGWVSRDLTILQTSRGVSSSPSSRATRALDRLLVIQIALAVTLLVGAGVMLRTLAALKGTDPGFESNGVAIFSVHGSDLAQPGWGITLVLRLVDRVARVPGVQAVTVGQCTPLSARCARLPLVIDGRNPAEAPDVGWHRVGPDHFRTLGIPVREGRGFTSSDRLGRAPVVVVNQAAAKRFWPDRSPLGQRVRLPELMPGDENSTAEVVGVVGDVTYWPPDQAPGPDVYQPALQFSHPWTTVMARVQGNPGAYTQAFRSAVSEVEPDLPIFDVGTLDELGARSRTDRRFVSSLLSVFALIALFLAAVGVYGVTAEWQARRRKELGVRLALGAEPQQIVGLALRRTLGRVAVGVGFGLAGSIVLSRLLEGFLFQVRPADPVALAGAALGMLIVAACAAFLPARAILRFDPARELGTE